MEQNIYSIQLHHIPLHSIPLRFIRLHSINPNEALFFMLQSTLS
jgi:hypothetical protein